MLFRKKQEKSGVLLPDSWKLEVESLLNSIYKHKCEETGKIFEVFGQTFHDELFIAASFLDKDGQGIPITYMISVDLDDEKKMTGLLDNLVDLIGMFFDGFFISHEGQEYQANWEEIKHKGRTIFYKITRENISLSIAADEILAKDDEI